MAKSADPVQAARKAAIKREAKRNRERRHQANEARTLRQDTTSLERQIQRLESRDAALNQEDQEELQRLRDEVASVKRIKEEYVRKHPDQRNFVRGYEVSSDGSSDKPATSSTHVHLRNSQSSPSTATAPGAASRDPRWSIYYDEVFNPYGAPPPGMPYLEKPHAQLIQEGLISAAKSPPLPEETEEQGLGLENDSDDSSVDEDLKDIVMPSGPPPIRLLPRASSSRIETRSAPTHPRDQGANRRGGRQSSGRGGRGRGAPSTHHQGGRHSPGFNPKGIEMLPQSLAPLPPRPPAGLPARPSAPVTAGNLASHASTQSTGPLKPPGPPPAVPDGVVISAEPQLRDLKKESTAFVPAAIRKKRQEEKARMQRGLPARIDAAPFSHEVSNSSSTSQKDRPDLLKSLQAHLPSKSAASSNESNDLAGSSTSKKDYDRFLDEIGDLL